MAEGVDIRIRTHGASRASRDVGRVSDGVDRLGRNARRSSGGLRVFTRATTSASGGMRLMGGAALYGGAALAGGLLIGIKRTTDAFNESRKVGAQTAAVIRSTGGAANVTATHVDRLATSISRKTATDDEAVQSGANLLLTFKRIRNETGAGNNVFDRATQAAVDLSAAGFGSIDSASKQLGKALNDPLKGITALGRAGVTFTKGQKERIERMVEEGNLLGAQRTILREVESQVGGSAKAQATATDRMKVSWENVQETIGKGLSPAVDAVASDIDRFLVKATPGIDRFGDRMGKLFGRKDLTLGEKLNLAGTDLARATGPLRKQLEREIGKLELGDKLAAAFEFAAPRMADAAGRAAPKVAGAFVNAFLHSGPYGQLFALGLLGSKLGAFGALGRLAAGRFRKSWKSNLGALPATVAPAVPTDASPGSPGSHPDGKNPKVGRRNAVRSLPVVGELAAAELFLHKPLEGVEHGIQRKMNNSPVGRTVDDILTWTPWGGTKRSRDKKGGGRVAAPRNARGQSINVHSSLVLDGKVVARVVKRVQADEKARR